MRAKATACSWQHLSISCLWYTHRRSTLEERVCHWTYNRMTLMWVLMDKTHQVIAVCKTHLRLCPLWFSHNNTGSKLWTICSFTEAKWFDLINSLARDNNCKPNITTIKMSFEIVFHHQWTFTGKILRNFVWIIGILSLMYILRKASPQELPLRFRAYSKTDNRQQTWSPKMILMTRPLTHQHDHTLQISN